MKIHEYQARELLASAGVPVPRGAMVESMAAAVEEIAMAGGGTCHMGCRHGARMKKQQSAGGQANNFSGTWGGPIFL